VASLRLENVTKRFGKTVALNGVSLEIRDGEFFAVLGPPGAGKTTLLRTIVGLEKPDAGEVYADGERITEVYPGDRDIAIMFQNLALYPDKTVFGNLAFPLKQARRPKSEIRERVERTAELLHITHLLDRKPAKLSGGERQRVALGRALVREPRAFLFDEPLSALDALLRLEMRAELKHLQRDLGRTLVYVTHDQVEAMSMPDRVAVLRAGVVQQVDTPENVYHRPVNRFVATVVGSPPMNFFPCTAGSRNGALHLRHPLFEVDVLAGGLPPGAIAEGAECLLGVRPEDVHVQTAGEDSFPATVYVSEPLGGETVVDLQVGHLLVKALAPASLQVEQDSLVQISLDPSRLHLFTGGGESVLSAAGENVFVVRATATPAAQPSQVRPLRGRDDL
jgi:multiple sugar transport system ATP-binding protein